MSSGKPNLSEDQAKALRAAVGGRRDQNLTPADNLGTMPESPGPPIKTQSEHFIEVIERLPDVNHLQRRVAFYISTGRATYEEIAARVGCTRAYVAVLAGDPRIKQLVEMFKGGQITELAEELNSHDILELAATRAAEVLIDKMNYALDESNRIKAAIEVLKLTNHYQDKGDAQVKIVINRDTVELYETARQEVMEAEIVE